MSLFTPRSSSQNRKTDTDYCELKKNPSPPPAFTVVIAVVGGNDIRHTPCGLVQCETNTIFLGFVFLFSTFPFAIRLILSCALSSIFIETKLKMHQCCKHKTIIPTKQYHNQGKEFEKSLKYLNMGFTGMFSVETILKIIGFGVKVGIRCNQIIFNS